MNVWILQHLASMTTRFYTRMLKLLRPSDKGAVGKEEKAHARHGGLKHVKSWSSILQRTRSPYHIRLSAISLERLEHPPSCRQLFGRWRSEPELRTELRNISGANHAPTILPQT